MSLQKIEQKNINRASSLVVRIERAIERNARELEAKEEERKAEMTRHAYAIEQIRQQVLTLEEVKIELESELTEAREYLKALTIEQSK